jgi:hypothetical protein
MNLFEEVKKFLESRTEYEGSLRDLRAIVLGVGYDLIRCRKCPAWLRKEDIVLTEERPAQDTFPIGQFYGGNSLPKRRLDHFLCPACGHKDIWVTPLHEKESDHATS